MQLWLEMKVISNVIAAGFLVLIWKYLKNKPLGMQTLLDSMIRDCILIVAPNLITSNLMFIKFKEEYSHETAMILIKTNQFAMMAWFLQVFVTVTIRYLSIFHQGILNEIKDSTIVVISRIIVGTSALGLTLLDDFGIGGPQYVFLTGKSYESEKAPKARIFAALLLANLVLALFVQIRIELLNRKLKAQLPYINPNQARAKNTLKNKFRYSAVVGIIFLLISLDYVFSLDSVNDGTLRTLRIRVIGQTLVTIVIPVIWLRKSKRFFDFFATLVLSYNCDLPIDPPMEVFRKKLKKLIPEPNIPSICDQLVQQGVLAGSISLPVNFDKKSQTVVIQISQEELSNQGGHISPVPGPSTSTVFQISQTRNCLPSVEC